VLSLRNILPKRHSGLATCCSIIVILYEPVNHNKQSRKFTWLDSNTENSRCIEPISAVLCNTLALPTFDVIF